MLRLCLHLVGGLLTCALIFPWLDAQRRAVRIQRWSRNLVAICGIRIDVSDAARSRPITPALIVANHVSWLDIFLLNAFCPSRFVAKSDVRDWPLIGWLCMRAGTVFIARGKTRDVRRIFENLVASLRAGENVAFFPEGATATQGVLLPFHANLFEAAIDAKVPIQPYAIRYVNSSGQFHPAANFVDDMTFVQSVFVIIRAKDMVAQLIPLSPIDSDTARRRELAVAAQRSIACALQYETDQPETDQPQYETDQPGF